MNKRIKNISLFLFWFLGLMFFLHAAVPHHHHFDSVYEHQVNQTEQNSNNHEDSPLHCHAFNDLMIDSDVAVSISVCYNNYTAIATDRFYDIQTAGTGSDRISCLMQDEKVSEVAITNNPTRGSPGKG